MDNQQLKQEADGLMTACRLADLLASYPQWFVGGSYSYDLMVWRDLARRRELTSASVPNGGVDSPGKYHLASTISLK